MKLKLGIGIVLATLVGMIYSCENKPIPALSTSLPSNCDTAKLTYSSGTNNMKPIIDIQCATGNSSCHSSSTFYSFVTYAGIYKYYSNGTLYSCLFQHSPYNMPLTPQAGWSDSSGCMLGKFKAWIAAGAPQ